MPNNRFQFFVKLFTPYFCFSQPQYCYILFVNTVFTPQKNSKISFYLLKCETPLVKFQKNTCTFFLQTVTTRSSSCPSCVRRLSSRSATAWKKSRTADLSTRRRRYTLLYSGRTRFCRYTRREFGRRRMFFKMMIGFIHTTLRRIKSHIRRINVPADPADSWIRLSVGFWVICRTNSATAVASSLLQNAFAFEVSFCGLFVVQFV